MAVWPPHGGHHCTYLTLAARLAVMLIDDLHIGDSYQLWTLFGPYDLSFAKTPSGT
jgi:hypothetical protein